MMGRVLVADEHGKRRNVFVHVHARGSDGRLQLSVVDSDHTHSCPCGKYHSSWLNIAVDPEFPEARKLYVPGMKFWLDGKMVRLFD